MSSRRKPHPRIHSLPHARATAELTALSGTASAAPYEPERKTTITEVRQQVDTLYREAELAADRYNGAKGRAAHQQDRVETPLDQVAKGTRSLDEARHDPRTLPRYAAEQYRTGGIAPATALPPSRNLKDYFDQKHLMRRLSDNQDAVIKNTVIKNTMNQKQHTTERRRQASRNLPEPTDAHKELADQKRTIQAKLANARELLAKLTDEERERLREPERGEKTEARERAKEVAREEAQREAATKRRDQRDGQAGEPDGSKRGRTSTADKIVAFARGQIGKPYIWGATGPNSYDCSGLTQAAWKTAGVELPRTTRDQVKVGKRVTSDELAPGDLVFFYDDISHVGLYIGGGQMIHAPKPGDRVEISRITEMPISARVRPT